MVTRRLSNTFLTVNMVMAFVFIGLWTLLGIMMFVMASMNDFIREGIQNGTIHTDAQDPELALEIAKTVLISIGVMFVVFALLAIPSAIVSAKARNSKSTGIFIAAIILSIVSFTEFGIAGGALGIVSAKREERNDRRNNIVDAQ